MSLNDAIRPDAAALDRPALLSYIKGHLPLE